MNLTERQFKTAFLSVAGIGRATLGRLQMVLAKYQVSELEFWYQPSTFFYNEAKITETQQYNFYQFKQQFSLEGYWEYLQQKEIAVLFENDDGYPNLLKQIKDNPLLLFIKNKFPTSLTLPIAIVGTRHMTGYGERVTQKIIKELASYDATIISGLMYGIDSCAHRAAIDNNLATIGVLGYGFDHCYPASHLKFYRDFLADGGVLITEFAPHIAANSYNFPARNRIVAGMSLAVVVTEAGKNSGTHITASIALENGRDVFVVPGSIDNIFCEGTKQLANEGGLLISSGMDIITALSSKFTQFAPKSNDRPTPKLCSIKFGSVLEEQIYTLLSDQYLSADDLAKTLKVSISEVTISLSLLEVQGSVKQLGDVWMINIV